MTKRCDWMEIYEKQKNNPNYQRIIRFCEKQGCIGYDVKCTVHPDYKSRDFNEWLKEKEVKVK